MRGWIAGQIILVIGILGLPGAARAQNFGSGSFASQAQAEAYLKANPTGPRAKAAFLAIVEFQLALENPGFSRSDIAKGVNLKVAAPTARPRPVSPRPSAANNERDGDGDLY